MKTFVIRTKPGHRMWDMQEDTVTAPDATTALLRFNPRPFALVGMWELTADGRVRIDTLSL